MSAERHKLTTNTSNLVSQMRNKMKTYPTLDHPRKVLVSDRRGCSLIKVVMLNSIDGHARYLTRERELLFKYLTWIQHIPITSHHDEHRKKHAR